MIELQRAEEDEDEEYEKVKQYEDLDEAKEAFKQYIRSYYGHVRLYDKERDRVLMKR